MQVSSFVCTKAGLLQRKKELLFGQMIDFHELMGFRNWQLISKQIESRCHSSWHFPIVMDCLDFQPILSHLAHGCMNFGQTRFNATSVQGNFVLHAQPFTHVTSQPLPWKTLSHMCVKMIHDGTLDNR